MNVLFDNHGLHFLLRWLHFLAGITWIGMLYYFNFVQTPFFKNADGAVRSGMIRNVVPVALWWFRWGAMITFLTGLGMIELQRRAGVPFESPYMTLILTGGLMGTIMWFNVWFLIWPAQKLVIRSAEQVAAGGEAIAEAAARGAKSGMVSRTNTFFSIPMLFFMGAASHLQTVQGLEPNLTAYWIAVLVVVALVEINALIGPGAPTQKPLTTVGGTITGGFVLAAVLFALAAAFLGGG
jgi:uncharacterized membrane protein